MKNILFTSLLITFFVLSLFSVSGQTSFMRYDSIALSPNLNQAMIAADDMDGDQQLEIISMYGSFGSSNTVITISKWLPNGSMFHTDYQIPYSDIRKFTTVDENSDGRKDIAFVSQYYSLD